MKLATKAVRRPWLRKECSIGLPFPPDLQRAVHSLTDDEMPRTTLCNAFYNFAVNISRKSSRIEPLESCRLVADDSHSEERDTCKQLTLRLPKVQPDPESRVREANDHGSLGMVRPRQRYRVLGCARNNTSRTFRFGHPNSQVIAQDVRISDFYQMHMIQNL